MAALEGGGKVCLRTQPGLAWPAVSVDEAGKQLVGYVRPRLH